MKQFTAEILMIKQSFAGGQRKWGEMEGEMDWPRTH